MKWVVSVLALAAVVGPAAAQPSVGTQTISQTPQTLTGGLVRDGTPHVCGVDMKPTTRVVYTSVEKDYCRYDGSILGMLRRCFGTGGECHMRHRTILVKKVVPVADVPYCVAKEGIGGCAPCGVPGPVPAAVPVPGAVPLPGAMPKAGYVGLAPQ